MDLFPLLHQGRSSVYLPTNLDLWTTSQIITQESGDEMLLS